LKRVSDEVVTEVTTSSETRWHIKRCRKVDVRLPGKRRMKEVSRAFFSLSASGPHE